MGARPESSPNIVAAKPWWAWPLKLIGQDENRLRFPRRRVSDVQHRQGSFQSPKRV